MLNQQTFQEIILTKGLPASGKSTWAKKMIRQSNNFKRVNKDDLRAMIDDSVWSENHEKFILNIRDYVVGEALRKDKNVIVDDTNFEEKHFDRMCEIAQNQNRNITVREMYFPVDLAEALKRNSSRTGVARVPDEIIHKMFNKYIDGRNVKERSETFTKRSERVPILKINNLPEAIICDLDGTISLFTPEMRNPYDASKCEFDILNRPLAEIIIALCKLGKKLIFVSGREDKYKEQTERFLHKHLDQLRDDGCIIPIQYDLYMRQTGDSRKDFLIKKEIYTQFIKDKYNVICVFDDRVSVCKMWRHELGLMVFQLNDIEF